MAVKQNNTDGNSPNPAVNGESSMSNGASGVAKGGGKNMHSDGGNGLNGMNSNAEQAGCNSTSQGMNSKGNIDSNISGIDLKQVLDLIQYVETQQPRQIMYPQDLLKLYRTIVLQLSRVRIPRQPDEIKRFKEDIIKVGEFLSKPADKRLFSFYLRIIYQLMTTTNEEAPSCAIAIIFQLFNYDMVHESVRSLFDQDITDESVRRTVHLLCDWLCICTFCKNLSVWIFVIMNELLTRAKGDLLDLISEDNIENLFQSLIYPALRPKVTHIVFYMLKNSPSSFLKVLPKVARVLNFLKQQANCSEDYADHTKEILKELVNHTSDLMIRFYGYNELYEPEAVLKDFRTTYDLPRPAIIGRSEEDDDSQIIANAKVGLVNLGNTCYMNSVLQALAMTAEFCREILLSESKSPLMVKMQQQIALMLYSSRFELIPTRVLDATRPPGFVAGLQQDSSEFLGHLLEILHQQEVAYQPSHKSNARSILPAQSNCNDSDTSKSELSAVAGVESLKAQVNQENTEVTTDNSSECTNTVSILNNSSTIEKTFTGKIATTFKCLTCGWKSSNVDSFRDLQLSFPELKNDCASNYSVQDLIDYFCSPEKMDGDNQYFCERCNKLSDAERYISVISAPKNLILTLKQFKYDQKYHMRAKLMHKVFHDEKVSVKVCSAETLDEVACVHYDLYAGVVHSGYSMDSGHYYTYAADGANKWYKFNDNVVTLSKSEELHNLSPPNTPYILFYQMGARSNEGLLETTQTTAVVASAGNTLVKVEVAKAPTLDELPSDIRDYVNRDNLTFTEELKMKRFRAMYKSNQQGDNGGGARSGGVNKRGYRDDEDDQPPPTGSCGDNIMGMNVNRFVF